MAIRIKLFSFLIIILAGFLMGCGLFYDYNTAGNSGENIGSSSEISRDNRGNVYVVKEVVDGDTLILTNNSRVRLVGINTPEYGMYFFEEAREALQTMVLGREVILEKDISETDKYGRLLRYVYVNNLFINLEMVKRGFANAYTYPPDIKYTEKFLEAERYARGNNLGLWQISEINKVKVEINYDALGNDNTNLNDEYVIIKNTGTSSVNTYGWTIKDSGTNIYKFGRYSFGPGAAIYLFTGKGQDKEGKFYWDSSGPIWNNDHDTLYLRDREGLLMEIYNY